MRKEGHIFLQNKHETIPLYAFLSLLHLHLHLHLHPLLLFPSWPDTSSVVKPSSEILATAPQAAAYLN
eukprot:gene271-145_t